MDKFTLKFLLKFILGCIVFILWGVFSIYTLGIVGIKMLIAGIDSTTAALVVWGSVRIIFSIPTFIVGALGFLVYIGKVLDY